MRCARGWVSSSGRCWAIRSAATSPSSTRLRIPTACRTLCCSIRAATVAGRSSTRLTSSPRAGYSAEKVKLVRRFFNGEIAPNEMLPALMRFGSAYYHRPSLLLLARQLLLEARHTKMRPEALIFAGRHLLKGWTVMDRLVEITAPTLVMAGRDDFLFPPEHQIELAAGIPNARLRIIERAGHNAHEERPDEVMEAVCDFIPAHAAISTGQSAIRNPRLWTAGALAALGAATAAFALHRGRTTGSRDAPAPWE